MRSASFLGQDSGPFPSAGVVSLVGADTFDRVHAFEIHGVTINLLLGRASVRVGQRVFGHKRL